MLSPPPSTKALLFLRKGDIYEKRLEHEDFTMSGGIDSSSVVESSLSLFTYVVSPFPSFSKKKKAFSFRVLKE